MSLLPAMTQHLKRKTLDDFFRASTSEQPLKIRKPNPEPQLKNPHPNPSPQSAASVPGLSILPSFVTPSEESSLLTFLSTQPWRTDLSRRTLHYGGTYCLLPPRTATPEERQRIESTILTAPPIPPEFKSLLDRMTDPQHALYTESTKPQFCIVNEYTHSAGISAHVENFRFAEPVCALTLGDSDFMRFHELVEPDDGSVRSGKARVAKRTGRRVDVFLPSRSLVVMRGESRWKWQHEIVRGRRGRNREGWRRVSLTFRTEREKGEK